MNKVKIKNYQLKQALSLLEILVAIGLFAVLTLAVVKVFIRVTDVQEKIHQDQNVQGDLQYALGILNNEAANSVVQTNDNCGDCSGCNGFYFCRNAASDILCFKDQAGTCIKYYRATSTKQLVVNRGGSVYNITSSDLQIQSLKFEPMGFGTNAFNSINIKIQAQSTSVSSSLIYYQTAITALQK